MPRGFNHVNRSDHIVGKLSNPGPRFFRNTDDSKVHNVYQVTAMKPKRRVCLCSIVALSFFHHSDQLSYRNVQQKFKERLKNRVKYESSSTHITGNDTEPLRPGIISQFLHAILSAGRMSSATIVNNNKIIVAPHNRW
jgi:hypothetical protein